MSDTEILDEIEVVDLEEYACSGKPLPKRIKYYLIKVDKEKIRVQSTITAEKILIAAGLDPCEYHLQQKLKGGKREKLEPNQIVDLSKPGVERFESVPKEACNG
ncbi:hypothetical protein MNBD_GAMMA12-350 [hydrothermal vent metagenome]|uniref:Multi-ubiquitin domain-containing protein n=1 Tax=hydrothermal vent metagenome TaxID=652676 RepID=A0A3B0YSF2_9ZZZZ